jgi:uncharacterized membrane protein
VTQREIRWQALGRGCRGTVGWLTFISGVVIGALIIVTAVVIAWRQRVIQLRDRAADRDREDARQQEREAHEGRVARREIWRAEYEAIWKPCLRQRGERHVPAEAADL